MATFRNDSAEVRVRPLVDKFEGEGPWPYRVTIAPDSPLLPSWEGTVKDTCGFGAASEAMDAYKRAHGMNLSTIWSL